MAQDPYGFDDSATPGADSSDASRAMWFGVISAMLGSVGICMCYIPYFIALPMGAYAAWKGVQAMGSTDARDRAMATAGVLGGGVSAAVSLLFVLFWLMYALIFVAYMVIVFIAIAAGAANQ